jgi:hypothetical protein
LDRIEELLTGPKAGRSRDELTALAKELAIKYFGPLKFLGDRSLICGQARATPL